jgi:hypothetical protein
MRRRRWRRSLLENRTYFNEEEQEEEEEEEEEKVLFEFDAVHSRYFATWALFFLFNTSCIFLKRLFQIGRNYA